MRSLKMGVVFAFLVAASVAINIQKLMWYKLPVKRIQGQIVDPSGAPVGLVGITVFEPPRGVVGRLTERPAEASEAKKSSRHPDRLAGIHVGLLRERPP